MASKTGDSGWSAPTSSSHHSMPSFSQLMLPLNMLPAQLPQPSVSVVGRPVVHPPLLAWAWGMLQTIRPTLARKASLTRRSSFSE